MPPRSRRRRSSGSVAGEGRVELPDRRVANEGEVGREQAVQRGPGEHDRAVGTKRDSTGPIGSTLDVIDRCPDEAVGTEAAVPAAVGVQAKGEEVLVPDLTLGPRRWAARRERRKRAAGAAVSTRRARSCRPAGRRRGASAPYVLTRPGRRRCRQRSCRCRPRRRLRRAAHAGQDERAEKHQSGPPETGHAPKITRLPAGYPLRPASRPRVARRCSPPKVSTEATEPRD